VFKLFEEESVIKLLDEEESVFKQLEEESVILCSNALRKNLSSNGLMKKNLCSNGLRKNLSSYGLMENLWLEEESVIMWLDGESVFKWFQEESDIIRLDEESACVQMAGLRKNLALILVTMAGIFSSAEMELCVRLLGKKES
jgi:hypothetical protein